VEKPTIEELLLASVEQHPSDLVKIVSERLGVSRQAVHRHLDRLIHSGTITKIGRRRGTKYYLTDHPISSVRLKTSDKLEEDRVYSEYVAPKLNAVPDNIRDICHYGFTEIMNNAIDHADANEIDIAVFVTNEDITIMIADNGIGIFKKIADALKLEDRREAILHLTKGKFTTDPDRHTGEGIFFTSRMFDEMTIRSGGLDFVRMFDDDWLIGRSNLGTGTAVSLSIARSSTRQMADVFERYTDPESLQFDKTQVVVRLSQLEGEKYISRSQAKRILLGLDRFKQVILDFQGVATVGQGFVDEVFRVYRNIHPEVRIEYVNANDNVEFMIRRGVSTASPSA